MHLTPSMFAKCFFYGLLSLLTACATILPSAKPPQINLISIKPLAAEGLEQRFSLTLKVTNPNDHSLAIKGMSYALRVEGFNLVSGVASGLPEIPAYDTKVIEIEAATNLINGMRFIQQLVTNQNLKDSLSYSLEADIDLENLLMPSILVVHEGKVPLR